MYQVDPMTYTHQRTATVAARDLTLSLHFSLHFSIHFTSLRARHFDSPTIHGVTREELLEFCIKNDIVILQMPHLVGPTMPVHPKPVLAEKSRRIAHAAEEMKLHAAAAACLQETLETSRFINFMDRLLYIRDNSHKFVTATNGSAVLQELVTGKVTVECAAVNDGS